jgi:hypothetical protein
MAVRGEELLICAGAGNLELEAWVVDPFQLEIAGLGCCLTIPFWLFNESGRKNEPGAILGSNMPGIDPHIHAFLCLVLDLKHQVSDVVSKSLAVGSGDGQVSSEAMASLDNIKSLVPGARLGIWGRRVLNSRSQTG